MIIILIHIPELSPKTYDASDRPLLTGCVKSGPVALGYRCRSGHLHKVLMNLCPSGIYELILKNHNLTVIIK